MKKERKRRESIEKARNFEVAIKREKPNKWKLIENKLQKRDRKRGRGRKGKRKRVNQFACVL